MVGAGGVPVEMVAPLTGRTVRMRGTDEALGHGVALRGEFGQTAPGSIGY